MTPEDLVEKYLLVPDPTALSGLSAVDWAAVEHAHGPATDVPALLRAAVSDDPDDRQFAFELLCETVVHQGTVYQATAHVVPFLCRLLESDQTPEKFEVAHLLTEIADCQSGTEDDIAASRQAVGKRLHLLYPFIRDPEPHVRYAVARAVGHYPEVVKRILPDLRAALRDETDEYAREAIRSLIVSQSRDSK